MSIRFAVVACLLMLTWGCVHSGAGTFSEPMDDHSITARIKEKIAADPQLSRLKVRVLTSGREVVLSGVVPSRKLEVRLIKLALRTKGVISVKDEISVRKE